MPKPTAPSWGPVLYRAGFAIFIAGCLLNAYDAYVSYTQASHGLIDGVRAIDKLNESWAFLGLVFILSIECAGMTMYKWTRRHIPEAQQTSQSVQKG